MLWQEGHRQRNCAITISMFTRDIANRPVPKPRLQDRKFRVQHFLRQASPILSKARLPRQEQSKLSFSVNATRRHVFSRPKDVESARSPERSPPRATKELSQMAKTETAQFLKFSTIRVKVSNCLWTNAFKPPKSRHGVLGKLQPQRSFVLNGRPTPGKSTLSSSQIAPVYGFDLHYSSLFATSVMGLTA